MRLFDSVITRLLSGPLEVMIADKLAAQVEELKLDALYRHRWHGDPSRPRTYAQAASFALSAGKQKLANGDLDGALERLREAVRLAPDEPQAHYQLGLAL